MTQRISRPSNVSRRILLQSSAAFITLRLTGCGSVSALQFGDKPNSKKRNESESNKKVDKEVEFVDQGYRLYGLVPEDDKTFLLERFQKMQLSPISIMPFHGLRDLTEEERENNSAFTWAIWANKEDVERVARTEGLKEVIEMKPAHVYESGSRDEAAGTLAVRFVAASSNGTMPAETSRTSEQIVGELKQAAGKVRGVTVKLKLRNEVDGFAIGDVPIEQIIVEFTTMRLDEEFLELIKEHPQVIQVKWDGLFTEFYCPGCGMG